MSSLECEDFEECVINWARDWDCIAYVDNSGFRTEVLVEEFDSEAEYELERNGIPLDVDGLDCWHIDMDMFKEYLEEGGYLEE